MVKAIKEKKNLYFIWMICLICILLNVCVNSFFSIIAFIILCVSFVLISTADSIILIIGIVPLANVFKLTPDSTSFFTICEIFLVLVLIIKKEKIELHFLIALLLLTIYLLVGSLGKLNILYIIKIVIGFILVCFAKCNIIKKDIKNIAYMLSLSVLITTVLSLNDSFFFLLKPYLGEISYVYAPSIGGDDNPIRISGFLADPNFFSMLIIMTLSLLSMLYYYRNIGNEFWIFFLVIGFLGFLTYSKSYFLCFVILCLFLFVFVLLPKYKKIAILAIFIILTIVMLTISGKIEIFNIIFDRFTGGKITTGRFDINRKFLEYIFSSSKNVFFGVGVSENNIPSIGNIVHNIYIELLFKLGVVGCCLYFYTILTLFYNRKIKNNIKIVNFLPLVFMIVMYFFLSGVNAFELPFYLIISYICLSYNFLEKNGSKKELILENKKLL